MKSYTFGVRPTDLRTRSDWFDMTLRSGGEMIHDGVTDVLPLWSAHRAEQDRKRFTTSRQRVGRQRLPLRISRAG
jgi:hypothetical protein